MKILVLGDRGRAHALVWKLFNSDRPSEIVCAPGNGGTGLLAPSASPPARNAAELAHWALSEGFNLIIPADPLYLQAGLADEALGFRLPVFGSTQQIAQLEQSRLWAKDFLLRNNIPTPRGRPFTDQQTAEKYLAGHPLPAALRSDLPLEHDGIYLERYEALQALDEVFRAPLPPGNLRGVIVEEAIRGPQVALSALSDGTTLLPLLPVRLYQHLAPAERGVYAPAIGAHSGNSRLFGALSQHLFQRVLQPIVAALKAEGQQAYGLIGVDCILGPDGPLATHVRSTWADLEAQVLLPRIDGDLLPMMEATIRHELKALPAIRWRSQASVAVGLLMEGYPDSGGDYIPITGLADIDPNTLVFHSQTASPHIIRYTSATAGSSDPDLLSRLANMTESFIKPNRPAMAGLLSAISTSGREVLSIVALGDTLEQARAHAYSNAVRIRYAGKLYRLDIAQREL